MKFILIAMLSLALAGAVSENNSDNTFSSKPDTYCNPRFGYCFTYDAGIFNKIPADINADGITITDKTGTVILDAYGAYNPYKISVSELQQDNLAYLLRNETSGPKSVNLYQDDHSYIMNFETGEASFKQLLIMDEFYYKVLTVKVNHAHSKVAKKVMETTHFVEDIAMAAK